VYNGYSTNQLQNTFAQGGEGGTRFMSPNARGGGVAGSQPMRTAVHIT
jgi:hypothetical protein